MANNAQRAEILVQALPYIQQYTGKIVVIKYGGNAMINEELKHAFAEDIVFLRRENRVGLRIPGLNEGANQRKHIDLTAHG